MHLKLYNHDGDIVQRSSTVWLHHESMSSKIAVIRLYVVHQGNGLFILERIPQSVGGKYQELGLCLGTFECQNVWFSCDEFTVFQRKISQSSGRGEDTCNAPNSIEWNEASSILDTVSFFWLKVENNGTCFNLSCKIETQPLKLLIIMLITQLKNNQLMVEPVKVGGICNSCHSYVIIIKY